MNDHVWLFQHKLNFLAWPSPFEKSWTLLLSIAYFSPLVPETTPWQNMLIKIEKCSPPGKGTHFLKTPDKICSLALLFQKRSPGQPFTKPCWEKLEKWWPSPGPSKIHIFLIRFSLGFTFFEMAPKTIPYQTMLGKVKILWPLPGPSQIHIFMIRFFSWLRFFRNVPGDNPLPDHVGKSWRNGEPCQDHHKSTYSW